MAEGRPQLMAIVKKHDISIKGSWVTNIWLKMITLQENMLAAKGLLEKVPCSFLERFPLFGQLVPHNFRVFVRKHQAAPDSDVVLEPCPLISDFETLTYYSMYLS